MPAQDARVVEEFFRAADRRDAEAMRTLLAPDVEWHTTRELPGGGVFRGPAAVEAVLREQDESFDEFAVELEHIREVGDHLVVTARLRGRIKGSEAEIDARVGQVWTVRDGRIARFRAFFDEREAVEVAQGSQAAA